MRKTRSRSAHSPATIELLERRELLTAIAASAVDPLFLKADIAIWRPASATLFVSSNRDGAANMAWSYGAPTDQITTGDINGDGLSDVIAFRNGVWFIDTNRDGVADMSVNFGGSGDRALVGDVNGDGLGDLILFHSGTWLTLTNKNGAFTGVPDATPSFGQAGDMPVVGDFNGDARLDRAVYRPSTGQWMIDYGFKGVVAKTLTFGGVAGDQPFVADMNNDGLADLGIYRSGGVYVDTSRTGVVTNYYTLGAAGDQVLSGTFDPSQLVHTLKPGFAVWRPSSATVFNDNGWNGAFATHGFGAPGSSDQILTGDFDGNTVTDTAIFRSGTWYIDTGFTGAVAQTATFGIAGDKALAGDVNNDGLSDIIVFRNGTWFVNYNRGGTFNGGVDATSTFGQAGDVPMVGDFNADGILDRAVYRPGTGKWLIDYGFTGATSLTVTFGGQVGDVPFAFDFNGDRKADLGIYRNGQWLINETKTDNAVSFTHTFGVAGDVPIPGFFDASNSIFVRPGGTGAGSEASPLGSISAAVSAAADGQFIRIAPGTYADFPNFVGRNNLTFVSNSRFGTTLAAPAGSALQMANSTNIYLYNMTFACSDASAQAGRGLVVVQSSAFGFGLRTNGNKQEGVYIAGATTGARAWFKDSNFDSTVSGSGIFVEENATLVVENSTADNNATGAHGATVQYGRGIIINGPGNIATFNGVQMDHNTDHGLVVDGIADLLMENCSASFNAAVNGAIFNKGVTFKVDSSVFSFNGTNATRGPNGFNGLELELDATGGGTVSNCTFQSNTAYGLFIGAGNNILVQGNTFRDNFCGVYLQGANKSSAQIFGNSFTNIVPTIQTANAVGVAADGPATATIGGITAGRANTFTNFTGSHAIFFSNPDANHVLPTFYVPVGGNVFVNSPTPVAGTPATGTGTVLHPVSGDAQSFFDEEYYLTNNPDINAAVISGAMPSGWAHFQAYGQYEGRNPSLLYNDHYYLTNYPDIAAAIASHAVVSGFQHFVFYGFAEGRQGNVLQPISGNIRSFFDEFFYLATNPDVAAAVHSGGLASGWAHFQAFGQYEGRRPSSIYDEHYYLAHNADVAAGVASHALADGFQHFVYYGFAEHRKGVGP